MRLTCTSRIIITAAGVVIVFLLLFPPWSERYYFLVEDWHHRMFLLYGRWEYDLHVDTRCLTLEIIAVVIVAGLLVMWLGRKRESSRDERTRDEELTCGKGE